MIITAFSDTHRAHNYVKVPVLTDILVCCGDAELDSASATMNFIDWMRVQPGVHKIFVPGNHDFYIQSNPKIAEEFKHCGIDVLIDESVVIDGIKFHGSPYTKKFCNWAFMTSEKELAKHYSLIPKDTDVLITHGPAYKVGDVAAVFQPDHLGSPSLYNRIMELDHLQFHLYGHIHGGNPDADALRIPYVAVNCSILDDNYKFKCQAKQIPIWKN